jgi:Holliday junction resolvase
MSSGPEKNVEDAIKAYLVRKGAFTIKVFANEMQGKGLPDLIVCYKGRYLAFEVKAPNGRVAKIQKATLRRIAKAGGIIASPRSLDEVRTIIEQIDQTS